MLDLGHCTLDLDGQSVRWPDRTVELTPIEARLLGHLAGRAGRVVPREELLTEVWGYHPASKTHTVGVIVRRVRSKIEVAPGQPTVLRTVRGQGWRLMLPEGLESDVESNVVAPRDRFFGRDAELATLGTERLVTVTGPPGVGKSRLAREHALHTIEAGRHREVWWVPLESCRTPEDVLTAVAGVVGLPLLDRGGVAEKVGRSLAGRGPIQVVLDGAEEVADVLGPFLDGWLDATRHVQFVVTSRRRLRVAGEHVVPLEPLDSEHAIPMLADRIRGRGVPADDTEGLAALVEALDGVPLALELVAARVPVLGLRSVTAAMDARDEGPLDAAVAWTVGCLDPWERAVLAQTAVFTGGFDRDAARAVLVVDDNHTVDGALTALLDWSLLQRTPPSRREGVVRFDTLATIRRVAEALPADPAVGLRHAAHYGGFGTDAALRSLDAEGGVERRARLADERANLERGVQRGTTDTAAGCAMALVAATNVMGPIEMGIRGLEHVLARPDLNPADQHRIRVSRVRALVHAGRFEEAGAELDALAAPAESGDPFWRARHAQIVYVLARRTRSGDLLAIGEEALRLSLATGDPKEISIAEMNLANALMDAGQVDRAVALQQQALDHATEAGDARGQVYVRGLQATWAFQREAPDALEQLIAARADAEAVGDTQTVGWLMTSLVSALRDAGRYDDAIEASESAIRLHQEMGSVAFVAVCRGNLADVFMEIDAVEEAIEQLELALPDLVGWAVARASFLCGLAEAKGRLGRGGLAEVEEAIELLQTAPPTRLAMAWLQRGMVALYADDEATARAALERADSIAEGHSAIGLRKAREDLISRLEAHLSAGTGASSSAPER